MTSGNEVLNRIGTQVSAAEAEVARASSRVRRLNEQQEQLRSEEARALASLASVRLGELAADRIRRDLDAADQQALDLLAQRQQQRDALARQIEQSAGKLAQFEAQRQQAVAARDAAATAHQQCANATLQELAADETYQLEHGKVEQLTAQAARADAKANQSEADRAHKRQPYERDKLFSYLWRRRYRFPDYRAWPLFRALDDWVAGLCHYDAAHRDYGMLLAIPTRLREHANGVAATAQAAAAQLAAIEQQALADAGAPALAEALQQRQRELDALGHAIEAAESAHDALLQQQGDSDAGNDAHSRQALQTIEHQLQREDVQTLRRDALATPTPQDDELVNTITTLRARQLELTQAIAEAEVPQQKARDALSDLQDLRRRFRQEGFDAEHSVFDSGLDLGGFLGSILSGAMRSSAGWSLLRRHQRFRSMPAARSGAQVAGQILGGLFSSGSRSSGSSIFRGGFGGGGFHSGGGFGGGGGGFRTGGGF